MSTTIGPAPLGRRAAASSTGRIARAAVPLLVDIRASHRLGHDWLTFEFEGDQPTRASLHYATTTLTDRFGRPLLLGGRWVALLRLCPASRRRPGFARTSPRLRPALPNLQQVTLLRDMGSAVCFALGLHDRVPLRTGTLTSPPRIFVDVPTLTWPVLRVGSVGPDVTAAQHLLRAGGEDVVVDGAFGPRTAAAVAGFERARCVGADGVVRSRTWALLTGAHLLGLGSRGDAVRALQVELGKNGRRTVLDGVFGARTELAVRRVQATTALPVDGVVGPATWRSLICRGHLS
jgi:Putative peptidoglycan binding domain